ncbi:aspartyl/asparaginyl beta-hydroxylase domain-containing protein [Synechococcales cyanobacterium C]|uniref:Aspartyl/asparaginyl beta-hydroxylase domain-containing protein n=1 Tax=Petrachloros mirabilis ULC683 TaxID=2781853 RepID=A0A8K2A635_9CYAN|nr:aspartyl/asparaginyl beta-hydroxylase domain-containing protein [Petrachloros mirabilis]NCJ04945.1 aspartyl/asparaginyl beta-hydroxylase domain-containing protein [Petrachloros mirabilis ULC683]
MANKDWVRVIVQSPVIDKLVKAVPDYSLIGESVLFTKEQFPWAETLEANWQVIRQELDQILEHTQALPNFQDIMPRQQEITQDDGWKTYFFCAFGFVAHKNCQRCPQTWELLRTIPDLKVAFFSILAPGKHIPEHYGKHKGLIRYHLALRVPEPRSQCQIRIADHTLTWEEGKSLIFDDTYPHEVWNNTDGYRVVLFLDIARPMRFPLSLINWSASQILRVSPLVKTAKQNHKAWEQRFESNMKP